MLVGALWPQASPAIANTSAVPAPSTMVKRSARIMAMSPLVSVLPCIKRYRKRAVGAATPDFCPTINTRRAHAWRELATIQGCSRSATLKQFWDSRLVRSLGTTMPIESEEKTGAWDAKAIHVCAGGDAHAGSPVRFRGGAESADNFCASMRLLACGLCHERDGCRDRADAQHSRHAYSACAVVAVHDRFAPATAGSAAAFPPRARKADGCRQWRREKLRRGRIVLFRRRAGRDGRALQSGRSYGGAPLAAARDAGQGERSKNRTQRHRHHQ